MSPGHHEEVHLAEPLQQRGQLLQLPPAGVEAGRVHHGHPGARLQYSCQRDLANVRSALRWILLGPSPC